MPSFPTGMFLVVPHPKWNSEIGKWVTQHKILTSDEPRILINTSETTEEGFDTTLEIYWADVDHGWLYYQNDGISRDCDGETMTHQVYRVGISKFCEDSYAIKPEYIKEGSPFLKWETLTDRHRDLAAEAAGY